jgi:hydroxysqualene synthase
MTTAADAGSGKTHRDENFPVASHLIAPRHRGPILAFYRFVRAADDVADHPTLDPNEKLVVIDRLEATLLGRSDAEPAGVALRNALAERSLPPRHAQDLLTAFRLDVTKRRYQDWNELIDYCAYSAMPVGRFVLDVHGENRDTWPANDALCATLQVINHLQDCAQDYRRLDRVYIPLDALAGEHEDVAALGRSESSMGLRRTIRHLAGRTGAMLDEAGALSNKVADLRLGLEVAVIERLARALIEILQRRDPLCEPVHLSKVRVAGISLIGTMGELGRRARRARRMAMHKAQDA